MRLSYGSGSKPFSPYGFFTSNPRGEALQFGSMTMGVSGSIARTASTVRQITARHEVVVSSFSRSIGSLKRS